MIDLAKLKSITERITVLYVEDNETLVKRMGEFLKRIFKHVYTATNGEKGIAMYKKHQPDLVITDLSMPVMDGHKMILNLKQLNANVTVIIISAYSDTNNLLKSMHLGVSDFIPKPVDSKLLQNILFKVCSRISKNLNTEEIAMVEKIDNSLNDNHEFLMKKLEIIYKSHVSVEFINHYKGVPIIEKGILVHVDYDSITAKVPFFQSLAIKYAKTTIIQSELLDLPLEVNLKEIHAYNDTLVLNNIHVEKNKYKKRHQLTVAPNEEVSVVMSINQKIIEHTLDIVSDNLIEVFINTSDLEIEEGEDIRMEFNLDFTNENNINIKKNFVTTGEVFSIDSSGSSSFVAILFQLEDLEKEYLSQYIKKRRLEIIVEFKQLKKN